MNTQQRKYALERIENHYHKRVDEIRREHTTAGKRLTDIEKIQALKEGKYTVEDPSADLPQHLRNKYYHYIVFTDDVPMTHDAEKIRELTDELKEKYDVVRDEIMLGNEKAALNLIREFTSD